MGRGAILPPVNIAVLQPAAPAGTPQQSIAVIAIPLVHGASIRIRSIAEAKPAPAAARLPTTMLAVLRATVHGYRTMGFCISVPRRARPVAILAMNTLTTPTRTATADVTTAAQPSA